MSRGHRVQKDYGTLRGADKGEPIAGVGESLATTYIVGEFVNRRECAPGRAVSFCQEPLMLQRMRIARERPAIVIK
jgi:hypothetical protein